ncbi:MAG TPA: citryl-CoA lyase, partial [Nocardioidaceae bacterium]|nr:citryl-CoA lyase [Nocardioidaceae bacterium]
LIGSVTASEYFWILLTGSRPSPQQAQMLDACIVAIAEHGLVPSVQAARMTYSSGPESLHGAVAAGLLGCGSVILGSSSETAGLLTSVVASAAPSESTASLEEAAVSALRELRAAGRTVPGVGHPLHRDADPRAAALLALAVRLEVAGPHVAALHAVVDAVPVVYGRTLPLNVNGAIPAVLLDVDFPVGAMKGVPLVGRTMSLVAHLLEEQEDPIGFGLAAAAEAAVES